MNYIAMQKNMLRVIMRVFEKYLLGYILLLVVDKLCLSKIHPLFSFAILVTVFVGVVGHEGKRFRVYLEKKHKNIYDEYRSRTLTGGLWLYKYTIQHSKKRKEEDFELSSYSRRGVYVSSLWFRGSLILVILSLA